MVIIQIQASDWSKISGVLLAQHPKTREIVCAVDAAPEDVCLTEINIIPPGFFQRVFPWDTAEMTLAEIEEALEIKAALGEEIFNTTRSLDAARAKMLEKKVAELEQRINRQETDMSVVKADFSIIKSGRATEKGDC